MEKLGVTVSLTSGYRPQSNGQVERINQELGRFLRSQGSIPSMDGVHPELVVHRQKDQADRHRVATPCTTLGIMSGSLPGTSHSACPARS